MSNCSANKPVPKYARESEEVALLADRDRLTSVIENVIRNAQDATTKEGHIEVRLCRQDEEAIITVEDDGCGMDSEVMSRIFEPFFTTKEVGVGTGLGLSVSYFIVTNNHNGSLSAESPPGQGAIFTIRLPLTDPLAFTTNGKNGNRPVSKENQRVG